MVKNLFKVTVLYNRECVIRYGHAFSEKQAKVAIANRIAKEQGVEPWVVARYFKEHPDRVSVAVEVEFKEAM